jgi:valyl-tRNA synthetase
MALDKHYNPGDVEDRQYAREEESGAFHCGGDGKPYAIVIPPPNVTGSLHIGHALNNTLQDVLVRFQRMRGRDVLWQPGTDHAGIATQMMVERQLAKEGIVLDRGEETVSDVADRKRIGREAFVKKVWEWKQVSGGTILNQLRRLGATCHWERERFTMDDGLSAAVRRVFVGLHKQGLIYRDKRLVNWDPRLHTAISDLEVEPRETNGFMWNIKYPIEDSDTDWITVATTRPETMLGDTAVAVHPEDPRYQDLIGRNAILPLADRPIPILADEHADPEAGTGAVKITPAHDFNDFEVGKRHGLPFVNIFDKNAHLNENTPAAYRGMDRFDAREKIVKDLEAAGLLESVQDHVLAVPHGDRSGVVIEPWLTDQWYVDAEKLARPAIEAVERGEVTFVPRRWEKTYFAWMNNIQPWCISRQLWWGHRIPAWYAPDGKIFVEMTDEEARDAAREHYGKDVSLTQDTDVLDTWFSSALWPYSTLGWPDQTPELSRYYPTDVLVTSFDIIFFWVARMMMMGLHFMEEVPFRHVYIHPLVRDEKGQKMSKSKGNVIDPLAFVDKYGADALRFTLTALAAQGREIMLSEQRVEGYRHFTNKLWNAARFCEMNECVPKKSHDPGGARQMVNRWITGATADMAEEVTRALDAFRFNEAASAVYQFTWGTFCDWYLEIIKPLLGGDDEMAKEETRATAAWVLSQILHVLHPMMPFLTEEIWERMVPGGGLLVTAPWPELAGQARDTEAAAEMDWVVRLIGQIRAVRSEVNVPAAAKIPMILRGASDESRRRLAGHTEEIQRLARLDGVAVEASGTPVPEESAQIVLGEALVVLPLAGVIDLAAEKARLAKELNRIFGEIAGIEKKLANNDFVSRAPEHVVEEQHKRRAAAEGVRERLSEALERLG